MRGEWRDHPVTSELVAELKETVDQMKEDWKNGLLSNMSMEASAMKNAEMIGAVNAYDSVIDHINELGKEDRGEENEWSPQVIES